MGRKVYVNPVMSELEALPDGYTRLEYIESTGTQYVKTGLSMPSGYRAVMDIEWTKLNGIILGSYDTTTPYYRNFFGAESGKWISGHLGYAYFGTISAGVRYVVDWCNVQNDMHCIVNGDALGYDTSGATSAQRSSDEIYLFSVNGDGSTGDSVSIRARVLGIYNPDGDVAGYYIPCKNPSGVVGLYDTVGGKFCGNSGSGSFVAGGVVEDKPFRKVKRIYGSAEGEVPVYSEGNVTKTLTSGDIGDVFSVENGAYYFAGDGATFKSNNAGEDGTTATTILTAKVDINSISFSYTVSSESNYDKLTIKVGGTTVANAIPGESTKTWSGTLAKGKTIELTYSKDGSQGKNDDCGYISNINVSYYGKVQTGTELKDVARRIKKGYVSIGRVARPFWGWGDIAFYGQVTSLVGARKDILGVSGANHAFFAGGMNGGNSSDVVEVFDESLVRSVIGAMSAVRSSLAGGEIGGNVLFSGGGTGAMMPYNDSVDAYDESLVKKVLEPMSVARCLHAAAKAGGCLLFAGGETRGAMPATAIVDAYDEALVRRTVSSMVEARLYLAGAEAGGNALFAGGLDINYEITDVVEAFDSSLTRKTLDALGVARDRLKGANAGDNALFAGGLEYGSAAVDAYTSSLTRVVPEQLSETKTSHAAGSFGESAMVVGGYSGGYGDLDADIYDSALTKTALRADGEGKFSFGMARVGRYMLLAGGGYYNTNNTDKVYAYTME